MPDLILASGLSIHYIEENRQGNPLVVLLHGLGANSASWQLQIPPLTRQGFHVLAPDAPGFGRSTYPRNNVSIPITAGFMAEFIEKMGNEQAVMVGISMGGALALQVALDNPQLVQGLVLVNTFASLRPKRPLVWLYFIWRFILVHTIGIPAQARAVALRIFPKPEQELLRKQLIDQVLQSSPRAYRATMRALAHFNVQKRLSEIHCPTLIITGKEDNTVPPENQQILVNHIYDAHQVIIQDAGHAVSVEQPEIFNEVLIRFLREML